MKMVVKYSWVSQQNDAHQKRLLKNDQRGYDMMGSSYLRTKIYTFSFGNRKHLPISMQNTVNMDEVAVALLGRCF